MSTRYVYVDESKRSGYVMAAVVLGDPEAARKAVRRLVLPGQRRLHMVRERPARKRQIIDMLVAAKVTATIYDAGHHHPSELAARAVCIRALVADLRGGDVQLVIERDEGLVRYDNQWMIEATRATGQRATLRFGHSHGWASSRFWPCPTRWRGAGPRAATGSGGSTRSSAPPRLSDPGQREARHYQPSGRLPGSLPAAQRIGRHHDSPPGTRPCARPWVRLTPDDQWEFPGA